MGTKPVNGPSVLPGITNLAYVEGLYESYLRDRQAVPPDWQEFFAQQANGESRSQPQFVPSFHPSSIFNPFGARAARTIGNLGRPGDTAFQDRVYLLIRLYRVRGHRIARVD